MKLIVGLGNPGKAYEDTRHNAGFLVLEELASRLQVKLRRKWFASAKTAGAVLDGEKVQLAMPLTYMNRSGHAVRALLHKQGLGEADLVVVMDDVELTNGQVRIRKKGGAGGHNGLQSVIGQLGTQEFVRVRVGVGPRPAGEDLVDYVLGRFTRSERKGIEAAAKTAADAVEAVVSEGADQAMNRFNKKQGEGGES